MTDLMPQDRALLDLARDGHDPSAEDRDRVRALLVGRLGAAAGLGAPVAGAVAGSSAASGGVVSAGGILVAKVIGSVAIVSALCAGGMAVHRVLRATPQVSSPLAVAVPPAAPASGGAAAAAPAALVPDVPVPAAATKDARPLVSPRLVAETLHIPATPTIRGSSATPAIHGSPSTPLPHGPSIGVTMSPREGVPASSQVPAPTAAPSALAITPAASASSTPAAPLVLSDTTLAAETRMIRAGLSALDSGDPARALAIFDEHSRDYPNGLLAEERDVERITALCDLGRAGEARAAAAVFLNAHPRTPLASRVLASCGRPIP